MKIYDEKIIDYWKGYGNMFVCHKTDNISKCEQFISELSGIKYKIIQNEI